MRHDLRHILQEETWGDLKGLWDLLELTNYKGALWAPALTGLSSSVPHAGGWEAGDGDTGHTHRPPAAPGGELEVGGQFDVRAQQSEQAQEEVHDLQGQEGQQALLPVLKGKSSILGVPCTSCPMQPEGPWRPLPGLQRPSLPGNYALPNHLCRSAEVTPWGSTCLPLSETLDTGRRQDLGPESRCPGRQQEHQEQSSSTEISARGSRTRVCLNSLLRTQEGKTLCPFGR